LSHASHRLKFLAGLPDKRAWKADYETITGHRAARGMGQVLYPVGPGFEEADHAGLEPTF